MPKYPKNHKDAEYYVQGRKRRVAGSTTATSLFLSIVHEDHPTLTIFQLREVITDKTKYILDPEAVSVLDAHIKAGYGDHIPNWRYKTMAKVSTIREKIAHLLALAESPEPEEAKAALLRARELMAKHKLRPEECVDVKDAKIIRQTIGVTCTAMTNPWASALAGVIAERYCCQAYRQRTPGAKVITIGLVGFEDDFEVAKRIFLYAHDCVTSAIKHSVKKDPKDPPGTYRGRCNEFGWGFVYGVAAAFRDQEEEHKDWGLVLVVPQAVVDSMSDMGKKTTFGKETNNHADCKAAGFREGRRFDPTRRVAAAPEMEQLSIMGA